LRLRILSLAHGSYRKTGPLHSKFKRHFGHDDDDVLVIRAASLQLNPMLDQAIVAAAIEDDPAAAKAEWLGEFPLVARAASVGFGHRDEPPPGQRTSRSAEWEDLRRRLRLSADAQIIHCGAH
jgi:hypothetical protein